MNRKTVATRKILFLGPKDSPVLIWLRGSGEKVIQMSDNILTPDLIDREGFTFLISYGYQYVLKKRILEKFPDAAINLHISYLPWNRGRDPNFWSFVEATPKGVTIHYMDEGIDTGDIIVQQEVTFDSAHETLASTYRTLQRTIQELFRRHWHQIIGGRCQRQKQVGKGSVHKNKDKEPLMWLLNKGWDTPVATLEAYADRVAADCRKIGR